MDAETLRFKIDDAEYDMPPLDDLDMDEWQIVYEYSGITFSDFAPEADRAEENIALAEQEDRAAEGETDDEKAARMAKREMELRALDGPLEQARQRRVSQPALTTAMLHIGYRRVHPDAKPEAIRAIVGAVKRAKYLEAVLGTVTADGDAEVPPAQTPEPAQSSPAGTGNSSEDGSEDSPTSSGEPAVRLVSTGTDG